MSLIHNCSLCGLGDKLCGHGETQVRAGGLKYQESVSNKNLTVAIPDMGIVWSH